MNHHACGCLRTGITGRLVVIGLLLLGACGVPDQRPATVITRVPYSLLEPEASETTSPQPTSASRPSVYLVRNESLIAVTGPDITSAEAQGAVSAMLERLALGPSEQQRDSGLTTALGPDTTLRLTSLRDQVATVDLRAGDQVPASSRVPLAVAQVVLTVTSVPGVDHVLLTRDGSPVEAPLPGGVLVDRPLGSSDYAGLVTGSPPTATQ